MLSCFVLANCQFHLLDPPAVIMSKELTTAEVASHNTKKDLYMIIHDKVYDVTSFVDEHPYVAAFSRLPLKSY